MALFEKFAPFKSRVIAYLNECVSVFEKIGNKIAAKNTKAFINSFDDMRYNLAVVGSLKRGKSTLLNTLMERNNDDISPVSFDVCTSAIIRYLDKELIRDGEKKEKAVIYFDGSQAPLDIPLERLRSYVTETENPENVKKVRSIEVYGDFPEWSKAVTLVDSPGQNAVYNYHDTLLIDFLPYADAIIFLIAADLPIDGGDLKLLKELKKDQQRKVFYVITKVERLEHPEDLKDIEQRVFSVLSENGLECEKVYKVSAEPVFEALKKGITGVELNELKAQNGIDELEKDLEAFVVQNSNQTNVIKNRVDIIKEIQSTLKTYRDNKGLDLTNKEFVIKTLITEKATLTDRNEELRRNAEKKLQEFECEWKGIQKSFFKKISAKAPVIDDKIVGSLKNSDLIKVITQSFDLHSIIEKNLYSEFNPLLIDLEKKLHEIANKLDEEQHEVANKPDEELQTEIFSFSMEKSHRRDIAASRAGVVGSAVIAVTLVSACYFVMDALRELFEGKGILDEFCDFCIGTGFKTFDNIATIVVCIAIVWLVLKVVKMGLSSLQKSRVPDISREIIEKMENDLIKALELSKDEIIKAYKQKIEYIIDENQKRINDIADELSGPNSDTINQLRNTLSEIDVILLNGKRLFLKQLEVDR